MTDLGTISVNYKGRFLCKMNRIEIVGLNVRNHLCSIPN